MRTPRLSLLVLALGFALLLADPARAMNCAQWARLSYDQKGQAISRMIDDAVAGQRGRQYQVSRNAIGRCLDARRQEILYAFDDTCADPTRAGMQALHNVFKNYIWSCVR